jgi:multidrug efflux system outer membrane protein
MQMNKPFQITRPLARTSAVLAAVLMVSACSLMPTYQRPALPVAEQWPGQSTGATHPATATAGDIAWKDFVADPTLQELITVALANNRDLRVASLNMAQAQAQLGLRRADQFPTVNASVAGSRTPNTSGGINSSYSAGLIVTAFELDFFGRVSSLKEQALAQYLATSEAAQAAQISLVATVAQGWLSLLADEDLLALSTRSLASREESLKLVELKLKNGAASDLDWRLAQTLYESARVTLAQQQRQRSLDENALTLVLGQPLPASVSAQLTTANTDRLAAMHFADSHAGMPSDLLSRRPDIRQAEQLLIASNANIGAARAAFFPRISLTTGVGSASNELTGLLKNGSWGWTMAPQLVLPIFDAGRNQANLDASKVGRDIAVAQYEKSIQIAFREVADALASRSTLDQQLQAQQALLQAENERSRLTQLRLDNGVANQLEWLDAQRSLVAAQQGLLQTQLAQLQNQITLFKVLGGGSRLPATSTAQ